MIRPVAVALGLLPGVDVDFLHSSSESVKQQCALFGQEGPFGFLEPASQWSEYVQAWLVAGTRELFPANGPAHKYAALFNPDPAFDALRFSFMVDADAELTLTAFKDRLETVVSEIDASYLTDIFLAALVKFTHAADAFAQVGLLRMPEDFAERAWPAYLETVMDNSYFFSIEELIVMASVAGITLVVFKARGGLYSLGGSFRAGAGERETVFVKLDVRGRQRIRGHFERCFRTSQLERLAGNNDRNDGAAPVPDAIAALDIEAESARADARDAASARMLVNLAAWKPKKQIL